MMSFCTTERKKMRNRVESALEKREKLEILFRTFTSFVKD